MASHSLSKPQVVASMDSTVAQGHSLLARGQGGVKQAVEQAWKSI